MCEINANEHWHGLLSDDLTLAAHQQIPLEQLFQLSLPQQEPPSHTPA